MKQEWAIRPMNDSLEGIIIVHLKCGVDVRHTFAGSIICRKCHAKAPEEYITKQRKLIWLWNRFIE